MDISFFIYYNGTQSYNKIETRVMKKMYFRLLKYLLDFFLYEKFVNSCRKTWIKTKRVALFLG